MANMHKFENPNAEVACLIYEKFTDKEIEAMGLQRIIAMHEPIKSYGGYPHLLGVGHDGIGRLLGMYDGEPDRGWTCNFGFAFAVPQIADNNREF